MGFDLEFQMTRGLLVSLWRDSFISGSVSLSFSPFGSFSFHHSHSVTFMILRSAHNFLLGSNK